MTMDYGRVYLSGWRFDESDGPEYVGVIWTPDDRGGKARQTWRGRRHPDPEQAFQEMQEAARTYIRPVVVWRYGNVRVGIVGGNKKTSAASLVG